MKIKLVFRSTCIIILYIISGCNNHKNIVLGNETIAKSFIESLNEHNVNKLISLFAENCLYEEVASGRSYSNKSRIADYIESTISGIPDSKFEIIEILANEHLAVIEWIWKGTNSVGWKDMEIPATNEYFELRGLSIMEIEDRLIKRNSDYWDWNSFMKGIGVN